MSVFLRASKLKGELRIPSSKSYAHRALICAALAEGNSRIENIYFSDDVKATLTALAAFGLTYKINANTIELIPSALKNPTEVIDCRASGSTLRFLMPLAFYLDKVCFDGRDKLVERPIGAYLALMQSEAIAYEYNGRLPVTIYGGKGISKEITIDASQSSQFVSALLLTATLAKAGLRLRLKDSSVSRPYIAMTMDVMQAFGVIVKEEKNQYYIKSGQSYKARTYILESDYSTAANFLVAGILGDGVCLQGLNKQSLQADKAVIDILKAMEAHVFWRGDNLIALPSKTKGISINVKDCPDLVPILAVLAAFSEGETEIYNAHHLRYKESDRLEAISTGLAKMGVDIVTTPTGLIIKGNAKLKAAKVSAYDDHRIAMALAIAASKNSETVILEGAESVNKSYPDFWHAYQALGGDFEQCNR